MMSKVAPLLSLDEAYVCAQAERRNPSMANRVHKSLTWSWKLTTGYLDRAICVTDPSERIHETAVLRVEDSAARHVRPPYGSPEFSELLKTRPEKIVPLSMAEKALIAQKTLVPPERILPKSRRRVSFCDRITRLLSGSGT
jgi:hypothetical protein